MAASDRTFSGIQKRIAHLGVAEYTDALSGTQPLFMDQDFLRIVRTESNPIVIILPASHKVPYGSTFFVIEDTALNDVTFRPENAETFIFGVSADSVLPADPTTGKRIIYLVNLKRSNNWFYYRADSPTDHSALSTPTYSAPYDQPFDGVGDTGAVAILDMPANVFTLDEERSWLSVTAFGTMLTDAGNSPGIQIGFRQGVGPVTSWSGDIDNSETLPTNFKVEIRLHRKDQISDDLELSYNSHYDDSTFKLEIVDALGLDLSQPWELLIIGDSAKTGMSGIISSFSAILHKPNPKIV